MSVLGGGAGWVKHLFWQFQNWNLLSRVPLRGPTRRRRDGELVVVAPNARFREIPKPFSNAEVDGNFLSVTSCR